MPAWIFGQPTKCTFTSMARAAACGSRQKSRTPSYSMPRPARVWGISGPCACGMGGLCSVWKPANLMGPASFSFSSNFAPPVVGPGDGLWSLPTTPLITTRDSTNRGGKSTPTVLSWTSFPLIVPNSTRSNECGSSHAVPACIIATSKILRTLSALSKRNLQIGHVATMCYADYAQLLKTLCLAVPIAYVLGRSACPGRPAFTQAVDKNPEKVRPTHTLGFVSLSANTRVHCFDCHAL